MLRTSSYTIYVDLPAQQDEMLLVHGYTGAHDRVSRPLADFLRSRETQRAPKPLYGDWRQDETTATASELPDPQLVAALKRRGYLTELDPTDEETLFSRLVEKLHQRALQRAPSYIFMPTYDCNLRCSYCFQDSMRTDCSFKHLLRTMRPAMVDRIFAALPAIEARHLGEGVEPERRNIGFFGGEPLLATNRPIVERIIDKSLELGEADFWAVTNGTELAAYEDLLGPERIAHLQITLDGPPRQHDERRIYADGSGSFERIARNIDMALARGTRVQVRLNVDRGNLADLPELADEIVDRGWSRQAGFSAYTATINAANDKTDRKTTMNSWQLDRALTELRAEHPNMVALGRPDEGLRARARQLFDPREEIFPQQRPSFCSAHDRMYIFDPFGDVYACWEKTGDPDVRIAHITPENDVRFRFELDQKWRSRTVASNPVCRRCRYALHCGGGCAILALQQQGKLEANYCDGFASRFRASVAEAYLAHVAGEDAPSYQQKMCDQ